LIEGIGGLSMHPNESLLKAKWAGRLEERERIARELHDTLLQSAQGLILTFQSVAGRLLPHDPVRRQIESALDQAGDLLGEARARVRDLRFSAPISNLSQAIQREGKNLSYSTSAAFVFKLEGDPRPVPPHVASEIFAIAREAITNAFAHSQATTVRADLVFNGTCLLVRVSDDGRGYEAAVRADGEEGLHFGIRGMRERARELGAQIIISSVRGAGTEIECAVPASTAYGSTAEVTRRQGDGLRDRSLSDMGARLVAAVYGHSAARKSCVELAS
jgi:signal transduction histidine kinase